MKKYLSEYPKLVSEWHSIKNKNLKPEDFTYGSKKKVWWQCPKGEDHEWESPINNRSSGRGCPFCDGKKTSKTNNLLVKHPKIASEWHPTKNGDLRPEDFTPMSGKKFWWKCPKGDDHEWEISIAHRSNGRRCPFCSGRKTSKANNLLVTNPILASEWHPTKNGDLRPENVTPGSDKKVWWKCPKGDDHEWETKIIVRNKGLRCPFCSGRKPSKANNLLVKNPTLASEWHPTKNGDLRPENVTKISNQKVWWKCPKGEDHEWETTIYSRSSGSGCPFCSGNRKSK